MGLGQFLVRLAILVIKDDFVSVPVVNAELEERVPDVLGGAEVVHRLGTH